ncbi:MAG: ECF transporter S component [Lachnotalea sp.]
MNKNTTNKNTTNTVNVASSIKLRQMVQIAMLSAVSVILMMFEIPLFFAPSFYKIDFSEVPVLIGAFAMGPLAGVVIELVKIILKFIMSGSITAGVGELANFLVGCAFVIPSGIIYRRNKTKKGAVIGMILGTISMAIVGGALNAFVLLPTYAKAFGMPIDALVEMGSTVNHLITNMTTFVLFAVVPFNLFKGVFVSIIVALIYKKIRPILK